MQEGSCADDYGFVHCHCCVDDITIWQDPNLSYFAGFGFKVEHENIMGSLMSSYFRNYVSFISLSRQPI